MLELNFRDERYLPFEGCGAISFWRLELPNPAVAKQFNNETISEVILHIKYSAREGGSRLKSIAETTLKYRLDIIKQQLNSENGLHFAVNIRQDMPKEWLLFKTNKTIGITISSNRLQYFIRALAGEINQITFIAKSACRLCNSKN